MFVEYYHQGFEFLVVVRPSPYHICVIRWKSVENGMTDTDEARTANGGGAVYNVDNLTIVTPRYHKEILSPSYHYGN